MCFLLSRITLITKGSKMLSMSLALTWEHRSLCPRRNFFHSPMILSTLRKFSKENFRIVGALIKSPKLPTNWTCCAVWGWKALYQLLALSRHNSFHSGSEEGSGWAQGDTSLTLLLIHSQSCLCFLHKNPRFDIHHLHKISHLLHKFLQ